MIIDSLYDPVYNYSDNYADGFRAETIYNDESYNFEFKIVLRTAGRYILLLTDMYQEHSGSGNANLNAEADAITFEGKCPTLGYYICSVIEGEDHLELFEDDLIYLDTEVYRGKLGSIEGNMGPTKSGGIPIEFSGFYGFNVVE